MTDSTPFHIDSELTGVAIAYQNPASALIADKVLPAVSVGTKKFDHIVYDDEIFMTLPDTKLGRSSYANRMQLESHVKVDSCLDYGLEDSIPLDDMMQAENSPRGFNPLMASVMYLTGLLQLDREKRVADLVSNINNYDASLRADIATSNRWQNDASDPIKVMLEALDKPLLRPNKIIFGQEVWSRLRHHPKVISALYGNNASGKLVSRETLAGVLEVDEVLVGSSYINIARRGENPSFIPSWGKNVAMLYIDPAVGTRHGVSWGYTATYEDIAVKRGRDERAGLNGSEIVKVTLSCREVAAASRAGYLLQNVMS
ncbi:MAG: hypothetical protein K0U45_07765 [Alphaproteobacteria bacterium]|nr:hypothetical protein [Alphaproteobacteria bacterium]